nr:hypothetical protein Itr_chr14CG06150 [Ipomoea trifida]
MKIGGEGTPCIATRCVFLRLCSGGSDLRIAEGKSGGTMVERVFIGGVRNSSGFEGFPAESVFSAVSEPSWSSGTPAQSGRLDFGLFTPKDSLAFSFTHRTSR